MAKFFNMIDSLPIVRLLYIAAILLPLGMVGNLWIDTSMMLRGNQTLILQGNMIANSDLLMTVFFRATMTLSSCLFQVMILIGLAEIIKIRQKNRREV